MNLDGKTTRITETAIITTLMTVFAIIGLYVFPIIIMIYPVPFIILGVRHGVKYNILSIMASSILISILVDVLTGVFVFILFGLFSISIAYMIEKKYKPSQILIGSTIVSLACAIVSIGIIGYITGLSFLSQINASLTESISIQMNMIKDMGLTSYEIDQIKELLKTTVEYMIIVIPATLIISSVFISYINYWVATAVLTRLGQKAVNIPRFINFRLPSNIILGAVVLFLASSIVKYFKIFYYDTIFINIIILIFFVFFVQGLAVIIFLMNKARMSKITKGILIFFILINVPFSIIVSFLGLLDVVIDFRKLKKV